MTKHRGRIDAAPFLGSGATSRPAFTNIVNKTLDETKHKVTTQPFASIRVRLLDVMGIPSTVQALSKVATVMFQQAVCHHSHDAFVRHPSLTVDLTGALDGLQRRLRAAERENSVFPKRVKELEYELKECNTNVVKEREALEALVIILREHLTRLISEVASHTSITVGLRVDAYAAREAQAEVETLHAEVERLAGEARRLKEVEEGLPERRHTKLGEDGSRDMKLGIDMTYVTAHILW
ncbi:hypothetical protein K439DRAFT_1620268 [Ramaria rubella]|nr:hypothetical protein K439DRAFT_1620268 [Ramaria rubella]